MKTGEDISVSKTKDNLLEEKSSVSKASEKRTEWSEPMKMITNTINYLETQVLKEMDTTNHGKDINPTIHPPSSSVMGK